MVTLSEEFQSLADMHAVDADAAAHERRVIVGDAEREAIRVTRERFMNHIADKDLEEIEAEEIK